MARARVPVRDFSRCRVGMFADHRARAIPCTDGVCRPACRALGCPDDRLNPVNAHARLVWRSGAGLSTCAHVPAWTCSPCPGYRCVRVARRPRRRPAGSCRILRPVLRSRTSKPGRRRSGPVHARATISDSRVLPVNRSVCALRHVQRVGRPPGQFERVNE